MNNKEQKSSIPPEESQNYIQILTEAKKNMPNLVLPSMGMIDNDIKVNIDGKDYIGKNEK